MPSYRILTVNARKKKIKRSVSPLWARIIVKIFHRESTQTGMLTQKRIHISMKGDIMQGYSRLWFLDVAGVFAWHMQRTAHVTFAVLSINCCIWFKICCTFSEIPWKLELLSLHFLRQYEIFSNRLNLNSCELSWLGENLTS